MPMQGYPGENDLDIMATDLVPPQGISVYSVNDKLQSKVKEISASDLLESILSRAGENEE